MKYTEMSIHKRISLKGMILSDRSQNRNIIAVQLVYHFYGFSKAVELLYMMIFQPEDQIQFINQLT